MNDTTPSIIIGKKGQKTQKPSLSASREIASLNLNPQNSRTHSDKQIKKIARSIEQFGFLNPVIIDKSGMVIAGHGRIAAAKLIGLTDVPVIQADHLTPAQVRAYTIADNRLAEDAGWDDTILTAELKALIEEGFDLTETGFEDKELEKLLAELQAPDPDADNTPEMPAAPVSVLGDIWDLGNHSVMCGSCTDPADITALVDGYTIDAVFSDPPYGIEAVKNKDRDAKTGKAGGGGMTRFGNQSDKSIKSKTYIKIQNDGDTNAARLFYSIVTNSNVLPRQPGIIILWGGNYFTDFLPASSCWLVWDKENTGNFAPVELAWTNQKGGSKKYNWLWNGLARKGDRETELQSRVHPTQKPVGMFLEVFDDFDFETCLDGFLGSGSTLIACEKAKRACFGMELEPGYVDVAVLRWQEYTGLKATHRFTKKTFDETAQERKNEMSTPR